MGVDTLSSKKMLTPAIIASLFGFFGYRSQAYPSKNQRLGIAAAFASGGFVIGIAFSLILGGASPTIEQVRRIEPSHICVDSYSCDFIRRGSTVYDPTLRRAELIITTRSWTPTGRLSLFALPSSSTKYKLRLPTNLKAPQAALPQSE